MTTQRPLRLKHRGQFSHFLCSAKVRGGRSEVFESLFRVRPRILHLKGATTAVWEIRYRCDWIIFKFWRRLLSGICQKAIAQPTGSILRRLVKFHHNRAMCGRIIEDSTNFSGQQQIYQSWVHYVDELKHSLLHVWRGMSLNIIDDANIESCGRFRACLRETVDTLSDYCDRSISIHSYNRLSSGVARICYEKGQRRHGTLTAGFRAGCIRLLDNS